MFLRALVPADNDELARFECAHPERAFEVDVETLIQMRAIG